MRLDRLGNTRRNIMIGEIDKVTGILLPFIVRTMMIHLLGAQYLGLTSLFYSIMQMLNLMEMGFGTAITYSMYKPIAENDGKTMNALLKYYSKIYRFVGIMIGIVGLAVMFFLPCLVHEAVPEKVNIYVVYLIFLLNSCLNCFLYPNRRALLTGYQRDDILGKMHIIAQFVLYGGQLLSIWLARDFYLYVIMIPVFTLLYALLCAYQSKKILGDYREEGELPLEVYEDLKKQVIGLIVRKLATYSRNTFDSMFISAFLGLEIVAVYGNYYYIMDSIVMLLAVVKTSMAGGVGNSIALDSVEKNALDMKRINFLYMIISGWCSICLLCLYQPFMKLWVGEDMLMPMYMAVLFAIYFYVLKMSDIRTLYSESMGIWWQGRYLSVVEATANIILNAVFIKWMGVFGIVLATLISYLFFNFIGGAVILYQYYFMDLKVGSYFMSHIRYGFVTLMIAFITYGVTAFVKIEGMGELIVKALICIVIPAILYFIFYCKTKDYKDSIFLVKAIFEWENNSNDKDF